MKALRLSLLLITLALILKASSCNDVKEVEYKGIKNTEIQSLGFKNAALRINIEYFNPNKFGVDVKESNLSIYLNDKFVGIADQPEKVQMPKNSNFIFPVVAHFEPMKILGTAFSSIFNKKNKLTIQGSAKVGKAGMYIKIPINITEEVSLISN
ncbi:MAG: LEA type 2 family protein [Bacteroidetes bacterium]|nr:LEA type 2 family protein [Bacteroidota bacterium]